MCHTYTPPYKLRMHSQQGLPTSTAACCIRKCQRSVRHLGEQRVRSRKRQHKTKQTKIIKSRTSVSKSCPWPLPLSQGDSGKLDQVSHAWGDDYRLFIGVTGFVVTLHLLHNKLGMAQQRVFSEAVEVQSRGRHCRLRVEKGLHKHKGHK